MYDGAAEGGFKQSFEQNKLKKNNKKKTLQTTKSPIQKNHNSLETG